MSTILEHRDFTLRKPSELTGDTIPWPNAIHHWTRDELCAFMEQHRVPPPSQSDVMRNGHERAVIDALTEGKAVPAEVHADYPDAASYAETLRHSRRALTGAAQHWAKVVEGWNRALPDADRAAILKAIAAAPMHDHPFEYNANVKGVGSFSIRLSWLIDTAPEQEFWFKRIRIESRWSRDFEQLSETIDEILVWRGTCPQGAAIEPLMRIPTNKIKRSFGI